MVWLRANGCPWGGNTFDEAAAYGSLENMIWLKANGCPWDERFEYAFDNVYSEMLEWLKDNRFIS